MGLTTSKSGKVQKTDVTITKNYLFESEISELNCIVVMWLDFAEDQARRRKDIFLKDWKEKLNAFLEFNDRKMKKNWTLNEFGRNGYDNEFLDVMRSMRRVPVSKI
jgi:hypothetical protein